MQDRTKNKEGTSSIWKQAFGEACFIFSKLNLNNRERAGGTKFWSLVLGISQSTAHECHTRKGIQACQKVPHLTIFTFIMHSHLEFSRINLELPGKQKGGSERY